MNSRANVFVAEVLAAACFLSGCSLKNPNTATEAPTAAPLTSPEHSPTAVPFSKTLRQALQDNHDETAVNHFSTAVLDGTVTRQQYELALKQNLAIFECMHQVMTSDTHLPPALRSQFTQDLSDVVSAFRSDLGMPRDAKLAESDILSSTRALIERLHSQSPEELAVCAYLDLGGNAFGTHDLAEALAAKGMQNTAGFTTYTRERFRELAAEMNRTFSDQSQFPHLIEAGRGFYQAHGRIYASDAFELK